MTKNNLKKIFLITLVILTFNTNIYGAEFPDTSIAIIDLNKILSESKAAVKAGKVIDDAAKNIEEELKISDESMLAEQQKLLEQQAIIAPEAFEKKAIEFDKKAQAYQIERQEKLLKIDMLIQEARNLILEAMKPILQSVSEKLEINIIIEKGSVILSDTEIDITKDVLKALNKDLPKIEISLE